MCHRTASFAKRLKKKKKTIDILTLNFYEK